MTAEKQVPALIGVDAIVAGEDYAITLSVVDEAGAALDLTDYTAGAEIRDQLKGATTRGPLVQAFAPDYSDAAAGNLRLTIDRTDTMAIAAQHYLWDAWIRDPVGEVAFLRSNIVAVEISATAPPA